MGRPNSVEDQAFSRGVQVGRFVSSSRVKTTLADYAGYSTFPEGPALNSVLGITNTAEQRLQGVIGRDVRQPGTPASVYPDTYSHPFDRFLARIAEEKAIKTLGHNRLRLVQAALTSHDLESGLGPVITNDSGWTFFNDGSQGKPGSGQKDVFGKVGDDPGNIAATARYIAEVHGSEENGKTPSEMRSETATAILLGPHEAALTYSTLSLGTVVPRPELEEELAEIMRLYPNVAAGLGLRSVLDAQLTDLKNMRFTVRLAGVMQRRQWYPLEPTVILENRSSHRIEQMLQIGDIDRLYAWAVGFSRGVSIPRITRVLDRGFTIDPSTGTAQINGQKEPQHDHS